MTDEPSGAKPKKPQKREGKLNVPLAFEDAIEAALNTKPPPEKKARARRKR